jgi:hypothetical protein
MTNDNFNRLYEENLAELGINPVKLARLNNGVKLTGEVEEDRATIKEHEEDIDPVLQEKAKRFIESCKEKNYSQRRIRRLVERKFKITIV